MCQKHESTKCRECQGVKKRFIRMMNIDLDIKKKERKKESKKERKKARKKERRKGKERQGK